MRPMFIFQHSNHKIVIYHLRKMATRVKIMDHNNGMIAMTMTLCEDITED